MRIHFLVICATVLCSGCSFFPYETRTRDAVTVRLASHEEEAGKTIYVVGHGWHTGLVVKARDVLPDVWPEIDDFVASDYVELGWGDEGFYQAKTIDPPLVLKAMFWPTPSVMHVAGFRGPVKEFYPLSDIIEVTLSDEQFDDLCRFISATVTRDESGESFPLGPGLYGESHFYRANGKYFVPKTCNIWTANALKAAGQPVISQTAMRAENVLGQCRRFGTVLQKSPRWLKRAVLWGGK